MVAKTLKRNDVVRAAELQGVGGVGAGDREDAAAERGSDLTGQVLIDVVELDGAVGGDVEGVAGAGNVEIRAADRLDRFVTAAGHDQHALGQGLIAAVGRTAERDRVVAAAQIDQDGVDLGGVPTAGDADDRDHVRDLTEVDLVGGARSVDREHAGGVERRGDRHQLAGFERLVLETTRGDWTDFFTSDLKRKAGTADERRCNRPGGVDESGLEEGKGSGRAPLLIATLGRPGELSKRWRAELRQIFGLDCRK